MSRKKHKFFLSNTSPRTPNNKFSEKNQLPFYSRNLFESRSLSPTRYHINFPIFIMKANTPNTILCELVDKMIKIFCKIPTKFMAWFSVTQRFHKLKTNEKFIIQQHTQANKFHCCLQTS